MNGDASDLASSSSLFDDGTALLSAPLGSAAVRAADCIHAVAEEVACGDRSQAWLGAHVFAGAANPKVRLGCRRVDVDAEVMWLDALLDVDGSQGYCARLHWLSPTAIAVEVTSCSGFSKSRKLTGVQRFTLFQFRNFEFTNSFDLVSYSGCSTPLHSAIRNFFVDTAENGSLKEFQISPPAFTYPRRRC